MTNYCGSQFIRGYAMLTHNLREMTKKTSQLKWTQQHEAAFQALKKALTTAPVLAHFNPLLSTELHADASPVGLCAILMQIDKDGTKRTVQYASRALTPVEQSYSQTEREALAEVWACEHLHIYIMSSAVTIYTDHKQFIPIFNNPLSKTTAQIEQWTLRLQPYKVTLKYRRGKDNPADYLSRHTPAVTQKSMREERILEEYINYVKIEKSTECDPTLQATIHAIRYGRWSQTGPGIDKQTLQSLHKVSNELSVTESGKLVLCGTHIVIPEELQKCAIELAHVGHQGIIKTKALIREKVRLSRIDNMVEKIIKNCMPCQVTTPSMTQEPLKMSPLPERLWSELSIAFGQVPGMSTYFLIILDNFSRYVIVETITALTSKAVIHVLDKVLGQFSIPDIINSDNGLPFNSNSFREFALHKGFKQRKITPLWPFANAEADRFMKMVKKTVKVAITK